MEVFERLLLEANYSTSKTEFLVDGFKDGFDLGYRGREKNPQKSSKFKIKSGQPDHALEQNYERSGKNRYTGPYSTIPFDYYIQSPVGLVLKDGGE